MWKFIILIFVFLTGCYTESIEPTTNKYIVISESDIKLFLSDVDNIAKEFGIILVKNTDVKHLVEHKPAIFNWYQKNDKTLFTLDNLSGKVEFKYMIFRQYFKNDNEYDSFYKKFDTVVNKYAIVE